MVIAMDKVMDSDTLVLPQEWQLAASNIWAMDSEEEIPELPKEDRIATLLDILWTLA